MKRLFAIFVTAALLLGCLTGFAAAAVAGPRTLRPLGDINGDDVTNAKDVTLLRRYLAGGYGVATMQQAADVNEDTVISAKDVTFLRRHLAGGYGIVLGAYVPGPERSFRGPVTGGELYAALGAPSFGGDGYTLRVFSDGVEQYPAPYAEKITEGNEDALSADDSLTETEKDDFTMTVTIRTQILFSDGSRYERVTIPFTGGDYRLLGRAVQDTDGVITDYSADGVEFRADCKGEILLTADASQLLTTYLKYRVIVDGVPSEQIGFRAKGEQTVSAGLNVPSGMHTIRIVKDTQMTSSRDLLKSVTLTCVRESVRATAPKAKLLEVIGDSTSAGYGIVTTDTPETTTNSSCAIYTYGYRAAQALDMDYDMIVRGTTGVLKRNGTPASNQRELYDFQNRYRDATLPRVHTRKADAVVFKLSGNDNSYTDDEVEAALRDLFQMVRERHGAETPIVLLYYSKSVHKAVAEKLVAEDPLIVGVIGVSDGKGMGTHPSYAAHETMTERVVEALRPLVEE